MLQSLPASITHHPEETFYSWRGTCLMQRTLFLFFFKKRSSTSDTSLVFYGEIYSNIFGYFLLPKSYCFSSLISCDSSLFWGAWHLLSLTQIQGSRCFFSGCGMPSGWLFCASSLCFSYTFTHRKTMQIQCRCWTEMENIQLVPSHNNMLGLLAASQLLTKQGALIGKIL